MIEYYAYINNSSKFKTDVVAEKKVVVKQKPKHIVVKPIEIALSQYAEASENFITAHNIADYRKRSYSLHLLPQVDVLFNRILEASPYYSKYMST